MRTTPTLKTVLLVATMLAISFGPSNDQAEGRDSVRLRVNDAEAEPGGLVAVVIRTDAPRPISQGQISVRVKRKARNRQAAQSVRRSAPPPLTLDSYKVFSQRGDAQVDVQVDTRGGSQIVVLQFSSQSGSINRSDGPVAVVYFRLATTAKPGREYELRIDAAQTSAVAPNGNPIHFVPGTGVLRVRKPDVEHLLEVEGDTVAPGEVAQVNLRTFEPVAMSQGHVEIQYDPAIIWNSPSVTMNLKHGNRQFAVDLSTPGLIIVDFSSPDASWNLVPGAILTIDLPTSRAVSKGTQSPITVDAAATVLLDSIGVPLAYSFKAGSVDFKGGKPADAGPWSLEIRPNRWRVEWLTNSSSSSDGSTLEARLEKGTYAAVSPGTVQLTGPEGTILPVSTRFTGSSFRAKFSKREAIGIVAGVAAGGSATVTLSGELSDGTQWSVSSTVSVHLGSDDGSGGQAQFDDDVASVDPSAGTITLNGGQVVAVSASTAWDTSGDLFSLADIASALTAGNSVEVEGDGVVQADGSILATSIKAKDDGPGGGGGSAQFDDDVASVDPSAGTITLNGGQVVAVNASTAWDTSGDLFSLADIAAALTAGNSVEVEGDGVVQADGSILATSIKAKDDGPGGGGGSAPFDDDVASVDPSAGTITLNGGQVVAVDASTMWVPGGDLFSLADIASALAAGNSVEVEGDGVAQADGSILATKIKAEDDGHGNGNGGGKAKFEDNVASVDQVAGTFTLNGGQVVAVDASTMWIPGGDYFSLADIASALAAGGSVEVKGKGQTQADGSILASNIKADLDD